MIKSAQLYSREKKSVLIAVISQSENFWELDIAVILLWQNV